MLEQAKMKSRHSCHHDQRSLEGLMGIAHSNAYYKAALTFDFKI